ncbi:FAD-dependent oxidoreductase [Sessilibacter corallicola]|uniref:D-amino acid dehydrogenase n=1 Tax=Sessilibacter corallicola TaxID=2904075 RepID=A0ABQ0AF81_9GAMM
MIDRSKHVVIVGAGIIGCTCALALAEQGYKVSVVDRNKSVAQGASQRNGSQLSYSYCDALAQPSILKTIPGLLLNKDDAFRVSYSLDPDFISWCLNFLKNCTEKKFQQNTAATLALALKSKGQMLVWQNKYNFDYQQQQVGKLHLYTDAVAFDKARRASTYKNSHGAHQIPIDGQAALEIEPALQKMNANVIGAIHSPDESVGNANIFSELAVQKAIGIGGGDLFLQTDVLDLSVKNGQCHALKTSNGDINGDIFVFCTGYESDQLAKKLGAKPKVQPMAGYSLTYPAGPNTPKVSLTDTDKRMVLCRLGDQLRVAGMAELGKHYKIAPAKRIATLKQNLLDRFPDAGDYTQDGEPWVGMRPMTCDSQAVITKTALKNAYLNTGHGMLGWTLAAGSAQRLVELIKQ